MIRISKSTALSAIESGKLPRRLIKQNVTIVMQQAGADRWLAALRDGKQRQGQHRLYSPRYGHCCLGLEQAANWGGKCEVEAEGSDFFRGLPSLGYLESTGKMYFDEKGDACNDPKLLRDNRWERASSLNDMVQLRFAQIADLIEKHIAVY